MADNFDRSQILASFLDEVSAYLPQIEACLDRLQQSPGDLASLDEAYRCTHTIAGSAAMMDFRSLAHVARGMEEKFGGALESRGGLAAPTLALLRRSLGRLARLVDAARAGGDNAALVAEDDADRASWRGTATSLPAMPHNRPSSISPGGPSSMIPGASYSQVPGGPPSMAPGMPNIPNMPTMRPSTAPPPRSGPAGAQGAQLPDWLAAFADPAPGMGGPGGGSGRGGPPSGVNPAWGASGAHPASQSGAWATSLSGLPTGAMPAGAPLPGAPSGPAANGGSGARGTTGAPHGPGMGAMPPSAEAGASSAAIAAQDTAIVPQAGNGASGRVASGRPGNGTGGPPAQSPGGAPSAASTAAIEELRTDAEAVRRQVGTLRDVVTTLRDAAQAMEGERTELRAFLDGSQDALTRLEQWAGQQMGLDLAGSPESVRQFLPLSVLWVTATRLKKLVALLNTAGRDLTATQEQIDETLGELHAAIEATAALSGGFVGAAGVAAGADGGFSATIAQISWAPTQASIPTVDSRPTAPDLSPGARAEIERHVREELRRSLEDEVRDEIAALVRRDEEQRLRHELEIEVRRQFLAQMAPGLGAVASGNTGVSQALPHLPVADRGPRAVQVTSEQSAEALEVFRDEAQEHLQTITSGIAQLERAPGNLEVVRSIRRAMHTLKGAAGMMGFAAIQTLAHASEDLLERLADGAVAFTPAVIGLILDTSDALDRLVSGQVARPEEQQKLLRGLTDRYNQLSGIRVEAAPTVPVAVAGKTAKATADAEQMVSSGGEDADLSVRLRLSKLDDLVNLFGELLVNRSILEERVGRLSALISESVRAGERLREVGGQIETRFEAATLPSGRPSGGLPDFGAASFGQSGGRPTGRARESSQGRGFDELELDRYTEFHQLSRGLAEGVADVATLSQEMESLVREVQTSFVRENRFSSDFQDRLLKARLVPLQSLIARLYRSTRATANAENKEVEFFVEGGETEVDRKVIEEVEGPLLHLVRNAVSHGIEAPKARERAGKPRAGKVIVSATYEGNQVVISVRDDGAGIDPERVRQRAVQKGWIERNARLSDRDAINLIFQPGVSTADAVTEQSGRGVGLDVVRDAVTHLRGTVDVVSSVGQGSTFTMRFPISLQIARAVLVRAGTQTVAIPMTVVEQIGRLDYYQRAPGAAPGVEVRGERYTLTHLATYLKTTPGHVDARSPVLLVNTGAQRLALLVDAIVTQQELVRKPLGAHLRDVRGIAGAAVLGNGQVVLILDLHELLSQGPTIPATLPEQGTAASSPSSMQIANAPTAPLGLAPAAPARPMPARPMPAPSAPPPSRIMTGGPATPNAPTVGGRVTIPTGAGYVLVVDDSPSVRRVVGNMLKTSGWEVETARDGVEALDVIARRRPAAVLLDIEMPRMDGYELMATLRSQEPYRTLPLIVLTSRAAAKHQQRATQLGADAYIVKPYQAEDLLGTIARLVGAGR